MSSALKYDLTGVAIPYDEPNILSDHGVIRRISEHFIVLDGNGNKKISSMALEPASGPYGGGLSVDLEHKILGAGINVVEFVTSPVWIGSIRFTAQQLRSEDLKVGYDPVIPDNPHHGEAWGSFTRGKKKKLLRISEWLVEIPDVSIE